ncbi:putative SUI2-translation initiation factor eIF-2 alpha chain [Ceraceosorus guamensis]|uniref:Eukaryotic translation initiation factor 2 subunit alpha n=1 Tax=Ceraceosorus guamensis TaxID=1522189 RepID=A0A316VU16_9BASI|nr:putative SUI2-translation initiation factor eIF-2 alpha chain [Ceraceosorus guamensis]PWN41079.1 putative SUI2-translation initiation factor eIF-2 alpha chain [Ceraceosorus guamensis]
MRFYEKTLPDAEDVVMVQVRQIAEMGAYVKLLEYDGVEGMILLSELSRRRIRSIQKLIRVGRNEVVVVLRVDKDKGYIDLSKRRVSPEDIIRCEERFNKSKAVHSILAHVSGKLNKPLEELYEAISWPLDKKFGHAYDAFKLAVTESETVFTGLELDADVQRELQANIARRMTPQPVKIRADVEVTCYNAAGIDGIKSALQAAEDLQTEEIPIKVKLIAPPLYVLVTNSTDKQGGIDLLKKALTTIDASIKKSGGNLAVKMEPKAVSESEDQELERLLQRVEKENEQVAGDDDDSDDEE